jgi:hypothetical protein
MIDPETQSIAWLRGKKKEDIVVDGACLSFPLKTTRAWLAAAAINLAN